MSKAPTQVGTNTTTTSNLPPAFASAAQQNYLGTVADLTSQFTNQSPTFMTAGFTPDQSMGFDLTRYMTEQAFSNPPASSFLQQGQLYAYPATSNTPSLPARIAATPTLIDQKNIYDVNAANLDPESIYKAIAALINPSQINQADAARSAASQLTAEGDIRPLFNPYQEDVVGKSTQQLEEANARQLTAIRAKQAAEGAYGGNRAALQESEQNRNFGNTLANTVAGLNYGGWNTAANLGMQNVGLRQQTGLANQMAEQQANLANQAALNQGVFTNQQAQQQVSLSNAAAQNQALYLNQQAAQQAAMANAAAHNQGLFSNQAAANQFELQNAGTANQFTLQQAQLLQQNALANQQAQQATNLFNAQQPLASAQMQNNLLNADWQRQMQALQALLGTGGQQQALAQQSINAPWTALQYLGGSIPSQYGSSGTSSQPIYGASTAQSILPYATLGASALGMLSDKTLKKDKDKLGTDPRTGLDMYSYRFKGEPGRAPKRVGPMAQQVEQKYPGSTARVGGKMMIKGNARTMLGI